MKKYNAIYFFLFMLLVMGAFASMAQNIYGLKIMTGVAFAFGLIFLIEFITRISSSEEKKFVDVVEPAALFLIALLFAFRAINFRFPYIEWVFKISALILVFIYFKNMLLRFNNYKVQSRFLAGQSVIYHMSIILFLISLMIYQASQRAAEVIGMIAFILIIFFIVGGLLKRNIIIEGNKINTFKMINNFRDRSVVLASLCLMFSLFFSLNKAGLLPGIYSDEYPQAYYSLVNDATIRKEKAVDGKFKYEIFKERYDVFLQHNPK